jgi:SNF2 family DNA or RNA helicase
MSVTRFTAGQNVRVRGLRALVTSVSPSSVDPECARIDLRVLSGERQGDLFSVFSPIDHVEPEQVPPLKIDRLASFALWTRYHDAYRLELAAPPNALTANPQAQIAIDKYQMVPAKKLLALPRPRLLIADDVGLGKTIEAGIAYLELAQRRLAKRVLIVTPSSIREQWRKELLEKFGIEFDVFDREAVDAYRRQAEIGANPWLLRPRIIVSIDTAKMDGTFAELRRTSWDLAIIDEAHHVTEKDEDDVTRNRMFARWLASSARGLVLLTATPHDGNDETFASLLRLLEPRIAIQGALEQPVVGEYVVRRLKRDIRNPDGSPKFVPREPVQGIPVALNDEARKRRCSQPDRLSVDDPAKASRIVSGCARANA